MVATFLCCSIDLHIAAVHPIVDHHYTSDYMYNYLIQEKDLNYQTRNNSCFQ